MRQALRWSVWPIAALLAVFNLRRLLFMLVAFVRTGSRGRVLPDATDWPTVLILVPCRDEAAALPGLIDSLTRLDYPADCLRVALVDDGSSDETPDLMQRAADRHAGWCVVRTASNLGKSRALNQALRQIAFGEVIVVYDADHRPHPDSLRHLVAAFNVASVAGASGRTIAFNPTASLPAYYATVESLVHQMITMQAKDRLDLAPALLGSNCAYRRCALEEVGGFRPGVLLEDSDLTLALARRGYRLRFVSQSVARHGMPETVGDYVRQHVRWARGFNDVAREQIRTTLADRRLPRRLRVELALFSFGYLDRLALLVAIGMQSFDRLFRFPLAVLGAALVMPFVQVVAVFASERAPVGMWLRLPAIPLLFGLDVFVAARAALESLTNRPRVWRRTRRMPLPPDRPSP